MPILGRGENEIATEVHCDARNILTDGGGRAKVGIGGFTREKINGRNKDNFYLGGVPRAWATGSLRAGTPSYAVDIQSAFHGFDTDRFLKSMLAELLLGNENVDIETRIRNDNSIVAEHVH